MSERVLAILEPESEYANLFLNFIEDKQEFPYKIRVFTKEQALLEYMEKTEVTVLLAAEQSNCMQLKEKCSKIILLTDTKGAATDHEESCIYKFQSAGQILKEVFQICSEEGKESACMYLPKKSHVARQYGVFSPYGGIGKTTLAMVLGHLLGKQQKVLVVNLEPFSKNYPWMQYRTGQGISQLVYYIIQGYADLDIKLAAMVESVGNTAYLCGPKHYLDLQAMKAEQMEKLLTALEQYSNYDVILYDISLVNQAMWNVCKRCDRILEPVFEEEKESMPAWAKSLSESEWDVIKKKRSSVVVPRIQEKYSSIEYISQGNFGNAVKAWMKKENIV